MQGPYVRKPFRGFQLIVMASLLRHRGCGVDASVIVQDQTHNYLDTTLQWGLQSALMCDIKMTLRSEALLLCCEVSGVRPSGRCLLESRSRGRILGQITDR